MNKKTMTHAHTLQLLATVELVTSRELQQRETAQAYFRTQLLGDVFGLRGDLMDIKHAAMNAVGRRKY